MTVEQVSNTSALRFGVSVSIRRGEFELQLAHDAATDATVIIGPNGSGKTTLLRSLVGDVTPASGRITAGDDVLFDSSASVNVPIWERRLGFVPQTGALFPHMNVEENVTYGVQGMDLAAKQKHVKRALAEAGLAELSARRVSELSGGQQKRVAVARAFAAQPRLLILDEPFVALDAFATGELIELLTGREPSVPWVLSTHNAGAVVALSERVASLVILVLEDGAISAAGDLAQVQSKTAFTRAFFGR